MSKETKTSDKHKNGNDFIADVSISLRDRFALAVVTGLTSATDADGFWTTYDCEDTIADLAYRIADECMKKRKQ